MDDIRKPAPQAGREMDTETTYNHYIMKKAKKKAADLLIDGFWSEYRDLNPRPLGPEAFKIHFLY